MLVRVFIFFVGLFVYAIWDNNRVKQVDQKIMLKQLSNKDEEFKILQITDLHEKEFGHHQHRLITKINKVDYDVIIFTGDMLDDSINYAPFFTLLDGIDNKEHALYIPGNADPKPYELKGATSFRKSKFVIGMEKRGVQFLESVYSVKRGSQTFYFVYFEYAIKNVLQSLNHLKEGRMTSNHPAFNNYMAYHLKKVEETEIFEIVSERDVIVALNHYPIADDHIEEIKSFNHLEFRNFDLIIAGHYHGGQIRTPFLGAMFVPEPYYKRKGLFPPQNRVKGLWEYNGTKQYVSAGLGSSESIRFMNFRWWNPPEINVITLKAKR